MRAVSFASTACQTSVAEGTLRMSLFVDAPLRRNHRSGHRFGRGEGTEATGEGGHGFGGVSSLLLRDPLYVGPGNHLVGCLCGLRFQLNRIVVDGHRFVDGSRAGILLICKVVRLRRRGSKASRGPTLAGGCMQARGRLGHHGLRCRGRQGFPVCAGWRRHRAGGAELRAVRDRSGHRMEGPHLGSVPQFVSRQWQPHWRAGFRSRSLLANQDCRGDDRDRPQRFPARAPICGEAAPRFGARGEARRPAGSRRQQTQRC